MARITKLSAEPKPKPKAVEPIIAYKGFNQDLSCNPGGVHFQYEIGKSYEHVGTVTRCGEGFHACRHPLAVFGFYPPNKARYAEVTVGGQIHDPGDSDTKLAAAKITINIELSIGDLVKRAWDYVWSRAKIEEGGHATGERGAASATGERGAASATGYQGAASATGDQGAASATGERGAASATGYQGAASATGERGAASATGVRGAASATGVRGAALASGYAGRVSGKDGNALFLVERDGNYNITATWSGIVGRSGVKADTWYTLRGGELVEA